jgi:hypothetical protein
MLGKKTYKVLSIGSVRGRKVYRQSAKRADCANYVIVMILIGVPGMRDDAVMERGYQTGDNDARDQEG